MAFQQIQRNALVDFDEASHVQDSLRTFGVHIHGVSSERSVRVDGMLDPLGCRDGMKLARGDTTPVKHDHGLNCKDAMHDSVVLPFRGCHEHFTVFECSLLCVEVRLPTTGCKADRNVSLYWLIQ